MAFNDPSGALDLKETNEQQALRLLGLAGNGVDRANKAATDYMNRNKSQPEPAAPEMVPVPEGVTEQDIAQAPPEVVQVAAQTNMVPKQYVDSVKTQQAAQGDVVKAEQQRQVATQQAAQVSAETAAPIPVIETPEQKIQTETNSMLKEIDTRRAKLQSDLANQKIEPKNFFSGKSTWQKIVSGIGLALASLNPQSAQTAVKIISDDIDRDIEAQKLKIAGKKEALNDADRQLVQLRSVIKDERVADMQARRDRLEVAKFYLAQQQAGVKSDMARQKIDLLKRQIDQEDEKIAITQKKLIEQGAGKPPNDNQFKAAGFAKSMEQSEGFVGKLAKTGQTGSGFGDAIAAITPQVLKGADRKKYESAMDSWIVNLLRYESGANVPVSEAKQYRDIYFPSFGDTTEVRQQKAQLRRQKVTSLRTAAGRAYDQVAEQGVPQVAGFKKK